MPDTIVKPLPQPWTVGGKVATDIEMRPPLLGDLIEAEKEAHPGMNPHGFNAALAAITTVRAGDFTGPFTSAQFKAMRTKNWNAVRAVMEEADKLGEDSQPSPGQTS